MDDYIREKQLAILERMYDKLVQLDESSQEFTDLLEQANKLYDSMTRSDQVVADRIKTKNMREIEELKCESNALIEQSKAESLAKLEAAKADKEVKLAKGERIFRILGGFFTNLVAALGIAAGVYTTAKQIEASNYRFDRATEKEEREPIITLTNKSVVQDGLKEPKTGFKFFK